MARACAAGFGFASGGEANAPAKQRPFCIIIGDLDPRLAWREPSAPKISACRTKVTVSPRILAYRNVVIQKAVSKAMLLSALEPQIRPYSADLRSACRMWGLVWGILLTRNISLTVRGCQSEQWLCVAGRLEVRHRVEVGCGASFVSISKVLFRQPPTRYAFMSYIPNCSYAPVTQV